MKTIGQILRQGREHKGLLLRQVAAELEIDPSLLSKIETGAKFPTKDQVARLAYIFQLDEKELLITYFSDRLVYEVRNEPFAVEALRMASKKLTSLIK